MSGAYYTVDQQTIASSYVARAGIITPSLIELSNPTNNANLITYSVTFVIQDAVPKAGYIQINFPPEIVL